MTLQKEIFQSSEDLIKEFLYQFANKSAQLPADWKRSVYIPIPKKEVRKECANCQSISLITHASKIRLNIIQHRLEAYIKRKQSDVQAGFRKAEEQDIIAE